MTAPGKIHSEAEFRTLPPPKVSIVVPVYNVERYIGRCFDSVVSQTYPNLECIFVDDCGTDASMDLLRERVANYRGRIAFKILRHERNSGLSAARNTGTDAASGDYVYFLDSDDVITADCIALLAEPLRERRVDFVLGNYVSGGERACFLPVRLPSGFFDGNEKIRSSYFRGDWFMMAWNKLVSRDFLNREKLRFCAGLLHEDNLWSFQLACLARSMCVVRAPTYVYMIRESSITTTKTRKKLDSLIRIAELMESFSRERGLLDDPETARFVASWREGLVSRARPYKASWKTYRDAVRVSGFSAKTFRALSGSEKLRYLHCLLPAPIGFSYLGAVNIFATAIRKCFRKMRKK